MSVESDKDAIRKVMYSVSEALEEKRRLVNDRLKGLTVADAMVMSANRALNAADDNRHRKNGYLERIQREYNDWSGFILFDLAENKIPDIRQVKKRANHFIKHIQNTTDKIGQVTHYLITAEAGFVKVPNYQEFLGTHEFLAPIELDDFTTIAYLEPTKETANPNAIATALCNRFVRGNVLIQSLIQFTGVEVLTLRQNGLRFWMKQDFK